MIPTKDQHRFLGCGVTDLTGPTLAEVGRELPEAQLSITRPPAGGTTSRAINEQYYVDDADLIDEDPPQDHETIAAMSHATSLATIECREAVARQVDAERALEVERRAAAAVRQRLLDATNSMGTARDMTGDPNVARYLTTAIDQAEVLP